jgi:hypothetical protein
MRNKTGSKIAALTVLMVFSFISMPELFAGDFYYYKMSLGTNVTSKILPLNNFEGNLEISQENRIMKNGFLQTGESFGYFRINLSSEFIGYGKRDTDITIWAVIAGMLSGGLSILITPIGEQRLNLCASVEILDINKEVIKKYDSSSILDAVYTIYDDDYTFKAEPIFRDLLKNCLTTASRDANEINTALISAKMIGKIPVNSKIAVIGANQDTDTVYGTRLIETKLSDTGKLKLVDRVSIDRLITEITFSRTVYVNDAIDVGRILNATYIVYVEKTGEGSNRKLNFRVLSVGTGEVITSYAYSFTEG